MSVKFKSICSKLVQEANKSPIKFQLAACLLQNGKIINTPKCNTFGNYSRGYLCSSIHAEVRTMLSHYGSQINYDKKYGWRFQTGKTKKCKKT